MKMEKPNVGDKVRLVGEGMNDMATGIVLEVYDSIDVWWDTAMGENKVTLMDYLEQNPEKAATATWYAIVENAEFPGETVAVASFECKPFKE